ncbi:MAG: reductive dehalogenase [Desulfobacula sp.]|nr:reductive dehalogenase [Desulfobacula sp.]
MKVNYLEKGASRYVIGETQSFDQKNEMFKRPLWDPKMLGLGKKFYKDKVMPKNKPGYMLKDQAAVNASWYLDDLCQKHTEKGGGKNLYAWDWNGRFSYPRVPSGLKISDEDPVSVTQGIKQVAALFGASMTGICKLDPRWVYASSYYITSEGGVEADNTVPDDYKYVVSIGVEMDYDSMMYSPAHPASVTTGLGYSKMAFVAGLVAQYIRGLGFKAIPCGNNTVCNIPIAIDAGLGEMARNGLLVTPELGPRLRLASVLTNLPLVPDRPIEFGVKDFCMICGKCARKCPSKAIAHGDPCPEPHNISNRKGVNTWHINAEKCLAFWTDNGTDCSNCIRVCPFNKPAGKLHDMVRWGINNMRRLDPLFLWGDDLMGYGKRKNAKYFWK